MAAPKCRRIVMRLIPIVLQSCYSHLIPSRAALQHTVIYLVRHGETEWNVAGRQQGHLDSALTAKGVAQARSAGRALRRVRSSVRDVTVESSPLGRARQTAALLCAQLDIAASAIVVSPLLIEHDLGTWQ